MSDKVNKVMSFREELEAVKKALETLDAQNSDKVNTLYRQVQNSFEVMKNVMDSTIKALNRALPGFTEGLNKELEDASFARLLDQQAKQKTQIEHLVSGGHYKAIETVTEVSLVIAEVTSKEGKVLSPRSAFTMESKDTAAAIKDGLLGKKTGETVVLEGGETLLVLEVYVPATPSSSPTTVNQE